jgi:polyphosphate glucokinase
MVGGTHVKILASGEKVKREMDSGPSLTARQMVSSVKKLADGWEYDVVSIGYPGPVVDDLPMAEPHNLGKGWMGFNFAAAFKLPTKVINDAAMQALGSYRGGKMLFLGLGTGLGSTMIVDGIVQPMELAHLPYKKRTCEGYVGLRALEEFGKKAWRKHVKDVVELKHHPGDYETVRRVLGHRSIQTTIKFYCGLETIAATEQFGKLIREQIEFEDEDA